MSMSQEAQLNFGVVLKGSMIFCHLALTMDAHWIPSTEMNFCISTYHSYMMTNKYSVAASLKFNVAIATASY